MAEMVVEVQVCMVVAEEEVGQACTVVVEAERGHMAAVMVPMASRLPEVLERQPTIDMSRAMKEVQEPASIRMAAKPKGPENFKSNQNVSFYSNSLNSKGSNNSEGKFHDTHLCDAYRCNEKQEACLRIHVDYRVARMICDD